MQITETKIQRSILNQARNELRQQKNLYIKGRPTNPDKIMSALEQAAEACKQLSLLENPSITDYNQNRAYYSKASDRYSSFQSPEAFLETGQNFGGLVNRFTQAAVGKIREGFKNLSAAVLGDDISLDWEQQEDLKIDHITPLESLISNTLTGSKYPSKVELLEELEDYLPHKSAKDEYIGIQDPLIHNNIDFTHFILTGKLESIEEQLDLHFLLYDRYGEESLDPNFLYENQEAYDFAKELAPKGFNLSYRILPNKKISPQLREAILYATKKASPLVHKPKVSEASTNQA
ncbi:MAG: hypothetical protein SFT81_02470 [Candidatus Caenarcaniphilales bacterium]|nr:hypothetical protein [Candidatus Caenarcaniphilales bacterium]